MLTMHIRPDVKSLWDTNVEESEADLVVGAHLLHHMQKHCANCDTPSTPLWRKGWEDVVLGHSVSLCNACGLKFLKEQYCHYCMFVYNMTDVRYQKDKWIACSKCRKCTHVDCEKRFGTVHVEDDTTSYRCPECCKSSTNSVYRLRGNTSCKDYSISSSSEEDYPELYCSTDDEEEWMDEEERRRMDRY